MAWKRIASWRFLLALAMLGPLAHAAPAHARSDAAPSFVDAGDLDPALFPLLDALLHPRDVPNVGPFRAITAYGGDMMLHFAGLVLLLPGGRADDASARPLVRSMLERRVAVTLVSGSAITYGRLADASPVTLAGGVPPLLEADGPLASVPAGIAAPEMQHLGGYDVPRPFAPFIAPDAIIRPTSHEPEAITRQAADLARAGMPLRAPVWIAVAGGYRLVQPFTRRVLLWDPATGAVSATDAGDVAALVRLVPDGGAGGALLADFAQRLISVEEGIGVAIAYTTPRGTLTLSLHGNERYPAASVMKLAILAACEDGFARGELRRDVETADLEEQMIVSSDNDAANDLIDFVGRDRINAVMRRIGMTHSYFGSHFDEAYGDDDDDNYLTPRESLRLMDALLGGEVGDAARIRDLLGRTEAPGSVRDALPGTTAPLYEKRGWYDGVENDVVRLDLGRGTTVTIAIFAPDIADIDAAWALFADLARLAVFVASSP